MIEKSETAIATSGLKIIGAGFGRTGTMSIKIALEELGFGPCYHMKEAQTHPKHMRLWDAAARGETVNRGEIFKGYQATVDWPACNFYKELMQAYPDAKVLLTVRDPKNWYQSVQSTLYQLPTRSPSLSFRLLFTLFLPEVLQITRMVNTLVWKGTFHDRFADKQYAIEVFNQHIEEVKKHVPPERLLVYNVKEGWEPLCTFLGVEVPDKPFPHFNDGTNFLADMENIRRQRLQRAIVRKAPIIASTIVICFFILLRLRKTKTQGRTLCFCQRHIQTKGKIV